MTEDEAKVAPPETGAVTRDKKRVVYSRDRDIFLYDAATGTTRQITKTEEAETDPHFTQDEKRVTFTRSNNLYVVSLDSGAIEQMTDILPAGSPPPAEDAKGTASQEALKKDQKDLFDTIRERTAEREEQEANASGNIRGSHSSSKPARRSFVAAHPGREVRDREYS